MQPQKKSVMELSPQGLAWSTLPSGAMYTMMAVLLNPVKVLKILKQKTQFQSEQDLSVCSMAHSATMHSVSKPG